MDFGGDLSVLEPAMVLQIMNMAQVTGVLKFVSTDNLASFYFKSGELICATVDTRSKKLGEVLVEKGLITTEQLSIALKEHATGRVHGRIGNILISHRYLDYATLASTVQEQMKEVVFDVLAWKSGFFFFMKGVAPKDEDVLLEVKVDHLILEGLKRLDEARN